MKPIRIAMILPGLGRVQRGAETAFLEVAHGLNQYPDIDIHLFGSNTFVPDGLKISAIECTPREKFENWPKIPALRSECHYEELSYVERLWRSSLFRSRNFDVTISCTYPWVHWLLRLAKRRNKALKNIFVTQNGDWMCRSRHREYRFFKTDGLVTINPDYYDSNYKRHNAVLIPNGTDPEIFFPRNQVKGDDPLDIELKVPEGKKVVLMVSAMIESKRVAEGLQAAAKVDDAFFVVAGDGPERENISKLAEELMPGRYQLLGSIQREQMPALFRRADVFLHMSQIEPFGIVYLEAAASGLPIVTHDGDTPRWILGETALFADSNHLELVADAIRQAFEPETAEVLGKAARQRVIEDWTWRAQAAKYRQFIYSVLDRPVPGEGGDDAFDCDRKLQHS
ncbi:MAG: glycosyltransferase family 4 protein [Planctomycetota bacterium]